MHLPVAAFSVLLGCLLLWTPAKGSLRGQSGVDESGAGTFFAQPSLTTATRDEMNLNGTWDFTPLDGSVGAGAKTSIRVPDAWDALPGFYDATRGVYERSVTVPPAWAGRQVMLEIYEANWHVDVTVNGTPFPRISEGIGIPTNLDITSAVQFGQANTVRVQVTMAGLGYAGSRPSGTFRWGQNLGLTGDVFLRSYPRVRIADAFVKTSVRQQSITVDYGVQNLEGGTKSLTLEPRVLDLNGQPVLDLPAVSVTVGPGLVTTSAQTAWPSPSLWTPGNPHLYFLETTLREGGNVVDVQRIRFGFREVWTSGTQVFLNGVPVVLMADSNDLFQHAFMNYYYDLWYDEAATRTTVEKLLLSRNAIRIHQAPAVRPHVLNVFDERGVLVISESAVYGGSYNQAGQPDLTNYINNALAWIPKWVVRERNHPSIVIWSAENEMGPGWLTQNESQLRRLGDLIRQLDPTRPVIYEGDHSCCGSDFNSLHYNQAGPNNDWPTDNDVYQWAQEYFNASKPNSQNEYAFTGWHGNGIFSATNGSSYTNLTSMQGTRIRGGLLTRGYRYRGWVTLAAHTYIWQWADMYLPDGRVDDEFVARSFLPVAAFDIAYDNMGENPIPPVIPADSNSFARDLVVYNQEVDGSDRVTLVVEARSDGEASPFFTHSQALDIPRGGKRDVRVTVQNLPSGSHWIQLELKVVKDGVERFAGETRDFWLEGQDTTPPAAPYGVRAEISGGRVGQLDRRMVYLTWTMPDPRGDLAGWVIYRSTTPNPTAIKDEVRIWGEKEKFDQVNEYFDTVPSGGTYYYRVAAKDLKGNVSPASEQVVVTLSDQGSYVRDPGFEMESRIYKNANNQFYGDRTWGERWTLPAIHGGSRAQPHSGRFAGLINGDGAHAENSFVDDFAFHQETLITAGQRYHLGGYFRIDRVWRVVPGWGGLWLSANTTSSWGGNQLGDATIEPDELRPLQQSGKWTYIYTTFTAQNPTWIHAWQIGDQLVDAYIDDIVLTPLDRIPPVALATASRTSVTPGQSVTFDASESYAFNTSGQPLSRGTGLTYVWDFGNGQTATAVSGQATYDYSGEFVASVTVTDQKGLSATAQHIISVAGSSPPPLPTFVDVPFDHPFHDDIEALYRAGYTAGCSTDPLMYCPEATMNRAESAVFVERGIHGTDGLPPPQPTTQTFADLPLDSWAAKWAEALWQDHYTAGCGTDPLIYCPWQGHTRAEGCVFYLHMLNGPTYQPPQPSQQTFADVPLEAWYAKWVQAGYDAALITPCQTTPDLRFCPNDPLSRAVAAYMMVQAKGLQ